MTYLLSIFLLLPAVLAVTNSTSPTSSSGYSTKVYDVSAATTTLTYDYSNEELAMLWNQVGKISVGPITTTVSPTPEPTSYPRPGAFHPMVKFPHATFTKSDNSQVPSYEPSLASAKLPANFKWGLAASAYQIEGAAKDEGKGPSIWDLLAHRGVGAVADNSTGDVVGSHYYLYKQDFARLASLGVPHFSPSFSWYVNLLLAKHPERSRYI
jgi:beta-glucosidase